MGPLADVAAGNLHAFPASSQRDSLLVKLALARSILRKTTVAIGGIFTPMLTEPPQAPLVMRQLTAIAPARTGRIRDIAATPLPPDTSDACLVALWLHGKSMDRIALTATMSRPSRRSSGSGLWR
jgi:hypothetical protein